MGFMYGPPVLLNSDGDCAGGSECTCSTSYGDFISSCGCAGISWVSVTCVFSTAGASTCDRSERNGER